MDNEDKNSRIFSKDVHYHIFGLIIATILTLCSCTRTIYVPQVSVERDSIYLHTHTRDSIMVHDSVTIMIKGDTVWQTTVRYEYKDRWHTDTIYIERSDSIRVPYPIEKKLSTMQKAWIKVGKISAGTLACAVVALLAYILALRKR